jgi:hypothetical protein
MRSLAKKLNRPMIVLAIAIGVLGAILLWNRFDAQRGVPGEYAQIKWPATMKLEQQSSVGGQNGLDEIWMYHYSYRDTDEQRLSEDMERSLQDAGYVVTSKKPRLGAQNSTIRLEVDYGDDGASTKAGEVKVNVQKIQ